MAKIPSLIFITGGVRSGKSSFAEKLAVQMAVETGCKLNYLATGAPSDPEMENRIKKHQRDREDGKYDWNTFEQSVQIGKLAEKFNNRDIILLDCVTTLLNNELFASTQEWNESFIGKLQENIINGVADLRKHAQTLIAVSNEVFYEPLAGNNLVFIYGQLLGQIHQQLVNEADQAYLVEAGIPIKMKDVTK